MNISIKKSVIAVSVIFIVGLATYAFAGRGYGYHMGGYGNGYNMGGYGPGYHMGGYGGGYHMGGYGGYHMGYGNGHMWNQLDEKDRAKMVENMNEFFNKTKDLRSEMYQKNLELEKELFKKDASKSKALELQKEISSLEAKFNEFRLEHMLKMQKDFPEFFGRK